MVWFVEYDIREYETYYTKLQNVLIIEIHLFVPVIIFNFKSDAIVHNIHSYKDIKVTACKTQFCAEKHAFIYN